jgi:hypothetical protein
MAAAELETGQHQAATPSTGEDRIGANATRRRLEQRPLVVSAAPGDRQVTLPTSPLPQH